VPFARRASVSLVRCRCTGVGEHHCAHRTVCAPVVAHRSHEKPKCAAGPIPHSEAHNLVRAVHWTRIQEKPGKTASRLLLILTHDLTVDRFLLATLTWQVDRTARVAVQLPACRAPCLYVYSARQYLDSTGQIIPLTSPDAMAATSGFPTFRKGLSFPEKASSFQGLHVLSLLGREGSAPSGMSTPDFPSKLPYR